jgi:hypothetical protein
MNLTDLRAMGLVQSNPLIKKDIKVKYYPLLPEDKWASPTVPEREAEQVEAKVTVHLRKYTAADKIMLSSCKGDADRAYMAIHLSTFTEDGEHLFPSWEDAVGLDLNMFGPLMRAINEINDLSEKKSPAMTNSSASLPSPSVDAASQNGGKH